MRRVTLALLITLASAAHGGPIAIAIHGGAGTLSRSELTDEARLAYESALIEARDAGYAVLAEGGSALDAVLVAVVQLEDSPLFNAGRGAVMTWAGQHELDASLMSGTNRSAGAVAGVRRTKNPILAAHAVMTQSPHVLLSGTGADQFSAEQGLEQVDNSYFTTERRHRSWRKLRDAQIEQKIVEKGTVGAVALDQSGQLAAGTSTGGMTGKRWGRVGDSPIIGAGTFADDRCAVSATGHGEYFIRFNVAADICARVRYESVDIDQAASAAIHGPMKASGGTGGVITLAADGTVAMPFNTEGMYRAAVDGNGRRSVAIGPEPASR